MLKRNIFKIFIVFALYLVIYGFFYPMMRFPYEAANPWPEAYQVIQKEIINQQKVPPDYIVQFGEKQPSDMTYFLNHHLMNVSLKLMDGLPFEINERFLSVLLTLVIFFSAFLFFTKAFGLYRGGLISILFMFLPRNLNYYTNINGEFLSLIVLFMSLYFTFDWLYFHKKKSLYVGIAMASILPILCLINLAVYCLVVAAYGVSTWLNMKNKKSIIRDYFKVFLLLVVGVIVFSLTPLVITGDIEAGSSSSIGSLYSKRDQVEIDYEKQYYRDYATYGRTFYKYPILLRDVYYLSLDGLKLSYLEVYFLFTALVGLALWLKVKKPDKEVSFGVVLAALFLILEVFLYSKIFNDNIYNSALRFLLYFSLPLIVLGAVGLDKLSNKRPYLLYIFFLSILASSVTVVQQSTHSTNMYKALYAQPYKNVISWAKFNIPSDELIMTNEWTNGQFFVQADKLDIVESGKASATYSTYTHIYDLLSKTKHVMSGKYSPDETAKILKDENIKYLIVWNRPAAYELFPQSAAEIKFDKLPYLDKVYGSAEVTAEGYQASASIYRVKTWQL